ncbi:cold-shock protein [Fulvivirga marina]|uniref:cold-shock protein n=1 Tax=Fulvivirga marina TaxID=2494733 RepID=UPI001EE2AF0F|nr:cold-shock protein [Fulvivirga marina]
MARSQNSFIKQQREKKKQKKKEEKLQKKQERKENSTGGNLDDMIAYVDEFGNITSTPPSEHEDTSSTKNDKADTSNQKKGI